MKKITINSLSILLLAFTLFGCSESGIEPKDGTEEVSEEVEEGLKFLREEEKLARDVYLSLYEKHNIMIFKNIAGSEQSHLDQILILLEKFNYIDSASPEMGVFNNSELQNLYNTLVEKGNLSIIDALEVGALIEDLDIKDIDVQMSKTNNTDILNTYSLLICGSRNHLRSFSSQLESYNVAYTPQYISLELYDDITLSSKETCGLSN